MTTTTDLRRISKQFSTSSLRSLPLQTCTKSPSTLASTANMLCQRCLSRFRATGPAAAKPQAARSALSTSSRLQRPVAYLSTARPQLRLPATQASFIQSKTRSNFHTTTASPRPAPSAAESNNPAAAVALEKPDFLDEAESVIWDRLVKEFNPVELVVQDISGGCGSMYGIEISSEKFRGANMLKQQRMVNAVLGDLLKGWHGCQLKTRVP